ncbi:MAG TPA: extracellular solute-binding protein [Urbifossiella sp.]|jgi:ABC-type glycerol-3-phosphate transport system substrate-binding protein
MARIWAHQTGAKVEISADRMTPDDQTDIGIVPYAELGGWANRGELVAIPASLKEPGHPFQWASILSVYRGEPYAGWGGQTFGIPLAADGSLILYRADRFADPQANAAFRQQFHRALAAPSTWEEFADAAAFFAKRDRKASLPRFTHDPDRLEDLFYRIAACFDRQARGTREEQPETSERLSFQFQLDQVKPRIDGTGFVAAAKWLDSLRTRDCLPTEGSTDIASSFDEDRAVLAMVNLDDLARLKRGGKFAERYGVAPLPGTRSVVDPSTGKMTATPGNYLPYFAGGWLGVVRRGCKNPDAAFALLAELGGPARGQEIIAAGGFGPLRDTQLEADRLLIWLGYGFDEARSKALQEALRHYLGKSVSNPAYGLRIPDQVKWSAALREELKKIADGQTAPEEGLRQAATAWERIDANVPSGRLKEWLRRSAGLN